MYLQSTIRTTFAMLAIVYVASAVLPVSISAQQAVGEAFDEGSVERAAKTKVDAAASKPRELIEAESKERAELLATFSYMLTKCSLVQCSNLSFKCMGPSNGSNN